ncbi:hypothetical protein C8T65DRAFT_745295 [Cerioporus squamosus]|nr:hypothetical protein C8T65DRAFT_745295 [Cerioporus squamosus]
MAYSSHLRPVRLHRRPIPSAPSGFSGRIELDGADVAKASFADEHFEDENTWVWIRVDSCDLLLSVMHSLNMALTCTYHIPEGEGEESVLDHMLGEPKLTIVLVPRIGLNQPVGVSQSPPPLTARTCSPALLLGARGVGAPPAGVCSAEPALSTITPCLYNKLYHKNGNRKEDSGYKRQKGRHLRSTP